MKLARHEPQTVPKPHMRAVEALVTETPQEDVIFDLQKFLHSPAILHLKSQLKEREVGQDPMSQSLIQAFWLARFNPELMEDIKRHKTKLREGVEKLFIQYNDFISQGDKIFKAIRTCDQHEILVAGLQVLFTPQEAPDLIVKLNIDLKQLLTLAKQQKFEARFMFARVLIIEFPKQREEILSTLFTPEERNPKKLLQKLEEIPFRPSQVKILPIVLEVYPELRTTLQPLTQKLLKEVNLEYNKELDLGADPDQQMVSFIQSAHRLAVLTAERTWIDDNGILHFEFKPTRLAKTVAPLPDRPTH